MMEVLVPIVLIGGGLYLITRKPKAGATPDPVSSAISGAWSAITGGGGSSGGGVKVSAATGYTADMDYWQKERTIWGHEANALNWEAFRSWAIYDRGYDPGPVAPAAFMAYKKPTSTTAAPRSVVSQYNQMTESHTWQAVTVYSDGTYDVQDISPGEYAAAGITPDSVQAYLAGLGYYQSTIDAALCTMFGVSCSVYTPPPPAPEPEYRGWSKEVWDLLPLWQAERIANGEDPCPAGPFRDHLIAIGWGDPGPAFVAFC